MPAVEVAVAVVVQVLDHLLGGAPDPSRRLDAGALIAAEGAEVASLGLDDAAGVVVGEWVLGVLGSGLRLVEAVAEGPGIRAEGRAEGTRFTGLELGVGAGGGGGRRKRREEGSAAGEEARPGPLHRRSSTSLLRFPLHW